MICNYASFLSLQFVVSLYQELGIHARFGCETWGLSREGKMKKAERRLKIFTIKHRHDFSSVLIDIW